MFFSSDLFSLPNSFLRFLIISSNSLLLSFLHLCFLPRPFVVIGLVARMSLDRPDAQARVQKLSKILPTFPMQNGYVPLCLHLIRLASLISLHPFDPHQEIASVQLYQWCLLINTTSNSNLTHLHHLSHQPLLSHTHSLWFSYLTSSTHSSYLFFFFALNLPFGIRFSDGQISIHFWRF